MKKKQVLARMWRKGNPFALFVKYRLAQPPWNTVWRSIKKLKVDLPFDPAIPSLEIYLKKSKPLIWKNVGTLVFIGALFTIQDLEAAHTSSSRWMDKPTMVHLLNGILLSLNKEEKFPLFDSMDWPEEHCAKWNKLVRERPYDFIHMWNLMTKLN